MIAQGLLKYIVEIVRDSPTINASGDVQNNRAVIVPICKAERIKLSGKRSTSNNQDEAENVVSWRIYYRPQISINDVLIHKGKEYKIAALIPDQFQNELVLQTTVDS